MKEKLKILFVVKNFPSISETFIVNQIIYLLEQGHDIKILATHKHDIALHGQIEEYKLMDKVHYTIKMPKNYSKRLYGAFNIIKNVLKNEQTLILGTLNPFKYVKEALNLSALYKVSWILDYQDDFDLVHAHFGFSSDFFFRAKKVGFFKNTKLITTFHGFDMALDDLMKNQKRYKELFKANSVLTTNNEYGKSLIQKIKPTYKHICLLPVSLDTRLFKPAATNYDKYYKIVFCGRLIKLKGPDLVIKIANELVNHRKIKNLEFEIIGDGKEKYYLETLIETYQLKSYVKLRGSLNQKKIVNTFQNSQILILPGITDENQRAETQGLVIQEAQAMKLPVLVSDAGGMKYGLLPEITGFVIPEGDIKGFSDKIEYLMKNPSVREKMGERGRDYIVNNFDIHPLGASLEQIYFEALKTIKN